VVDIHKDKITLISTNIWVIKGIFKPRPYFWHEIRLSTHREHFDESRRPSEDI